MRASRKFVLTQAGVYVYDDVNAQVRQVACGPTCSFAVTNQGSLLMWGDTSWCVSDGTGSGADSDSEGEEQGVGAVADGGVSGVEWVPREVEVRGEEVWEVSCGLHHAALVTMSGRLMTWGINFAGQVQRAWSLRILSAGNALLHVHARAQSRVQTRGANRLT
jgi:alpha-tubulin suppressor-like RCC1 family protein